jgi:hypothetical protein
MYWPSYSAWRVVSGTVLRPLVGTSRSSQTRRSMTSFLASRPSQVPLAQSEEHLEDLGDRMERTLPVVQGLLERADAVRVGLHARNSVQ